MTPFAAPAPPSEVPPSESLTATPTVFAPKVCSLPAKSNAWTL